MAEAKGGTAASPGLGARFARGKMVEPAQTQSLLEAVIVSGDKVCLEGDNQKQADFLAEVLARMDPKTIHDLHIVQSGIVLQAHLDLFERGTARKLDFSYSGPQGAAIARALAAGKIELGAIHIQTRHPAGKGKGSPTSTRSSPGCAWPSASRCAFTSMRCPPA